MGGGVCFSIGADGGSEARTLLEAILPADMMLRRAA